MRLHKLSANQPSFRTLIFNERGLSLIVGKKGDPEDHGTEKSFNGVGKSLSLYLIYFCLGGKENDQLREKLPGWVFSLEFELKGSLYRVSRSTDNQGVVICNSNELKLKEYINWLGHELFQLPPKVKYLTYYCLIGLFIRQGESAYISYERTNRNEKQYSQLIRNAYLLGLDIDLVDRKRELREEATRLDTLKKSFKKDSFLREYFIEDRDVDLELQDFEDEIKRLESDLQNFNIAENYEIIEREAEEARIQWRKLRNERHLVERSLQQISDSLQEQPEIDAEEVEKLYSVAKKELPEMVCRRLEEVTDFHTSLMEMREVRLNREKRKLGRLLEQIDSELGRLEKLKDSQLKFLNGHGKLQDYEAILNKLSDIKRKAERLRDYSNLEESWRHQTAESRAAMGQEDLRAVDYLKAAEPLTNRIRGCFRRMAQRVYPGKSSGIIIRSNEGNNLLRFDIDARIQADSSGGIGKSKLFCFDMTVLLEGGNHHMKFLMHDSQLYPPIDPRQRVEVFRIANEYLEEHGMQYIASLNQDSLDAMRGEMDPEEYQELFENNTIIELTDESDESKLLGISVELAYERR